MRGGKRTGAGRKKGPEKKELNARVLPVTLQEIHRRSAQYKSIGEMLDNAFTPRQVTCYK